MADVFAIPLFADQPAGNVIESPSTDLEAPPAVHDEFFHLMKRPRHNHDSCGCPYIEEYEDFGASSYPRYHKVKKCDGEKIHQENFNQRCIYGGKCREFHHEIRYLVPMESEGFGVHLLPGQLNKTYGWVTRNIAIDCRCGH